MNLYHLVVLIHGLWGTPSHMAYLAEQIEQCVKPQDPHEQIVVYPTNSHSGYRTYDGIGVNGKRVADEILAQLKALERDGTVTKISMIGYSMGGLIARYAIGVLKHMGCFKSSKPMFFVTFCTPHVGAVNPSSLLSSRIFNMVAPHVLSDTGLQMFLQDRSPVSGKEHLPLLEWMADPASKFFKALEMFSNRTVYSNIINDKRTSWYTTAISELDPFNSMINESLSAYELNYVSGYEPTVVDFTKPTSFTPKLRPCQTGLDAKKIVFRIFVWLRLFSRLILFTPIYSLYLLCNYIWQRIKLSHRLRSFARESAEGLEPLYLLGERHGFFYDSDSEKNYDSDVESTSSQYEGYMNVLEETARDGTDLFVESTSSQYEGYMNVLEETARDGTDLFVESVYEAMNSADYYDYHSSVIQRQKKSSGAKISSDGALVDLQGKKVDKFKLELMPSQTRIVSHLNTLKWDKFPVIIRKTKATHAAVINRYPDPAFAEGKVVVAHFVNEVFRV